MSTPANIIILNHNIKVNKKLTKKQIQNLDGEIVYYVHHDGDNLIDIFIREFLELKGAINRKHDNNYLLSWLGTYYNINHARYLNENIISENNFKKRRDLLKNYEFMEKDFKNLFDFSGAGIFLFNEVYYEYLYIICPLDNGNNLVKQENNFIVYLFDENYIKLNEIVI